jgi:hypothetical protein
MPYPPSAYDLHQRERWTRHDAHLWIRHDAARWLKPGTDPAEVFPELKRQREAAEDAAFAAQVAASRRFLAALRVEVDELLRERDGRRPRCAGWRAPRRGDLCRCRRRTEGGSVKTATRGRHWPSGAQK